MRVLRLHCPIRYMGVDYTEIAPLPRMLTAQPEEDILAE